MAYAVNMIQRASDGLLYTGGGFIEVTDQRNYASVAMFGGNPDDVANLVSGLPNGEYRVIPYWAPGREGEDFPQVSTTIFSNFTAGAAANSIDITIDGRGAATGNFSEIYNAWQSNGGPLILLFFTEAQANSMNGLNYWDGSLGLREYAGYFFCELGLGSTSSGGTSAVAQSTFSGTVLWALFM
jgi:hypothetical protein